MTWLPLLGLFFVSRPIPLTPAGMSLPPPSVSRTELPTATPTPNGAPGFSVWNVGQGLWTTLITDSTCYHFDMGGERAPWKLILASCRLKENRASLSHWDWDHVSFVREASRRLGRFCLTGPPAGPAPPKRAALLDGIPLCALAPVGSRAHDLSRAPPPVRITFENRLPRPHRGGTPPGRPPRPAVGANEWSRVFLVPAPGAMKKFVLVPGDSDQKAEHRWARALAHQPVWIFVLGHHGSRTSTSSELLTYLRQTRTAVASARAAKYGHPHVEVVRKLRERGIALLKTEDWGTLRFSTQP